VGLPRLRQVAFAAADLETVAGQLRQLLHLAEPYADEGVAVFGLHNAVFALGDTFLEVVSPTREGTAAGRFLERQGGDTGYMAMVQIADAGAARERLSALGIRIVWDYSEADIVDLHLHPRDVPGPLLALDRAEPLGSWRWGGPAWTDNVPTHPPGGIRELVVAVPEPEAAAARWGQILDVRPHESGLTLDDGQQIRFVAPGRSDRDGIVGLTVAVPDPHRKSVDVAGVHLELLPVGTL
jgi:hypothetical protein